MPREERERLGDSVRAILGSFLAGSVIITGLSLLAGRDAMLRVTLTVAAAGVAALLLGRLGHERTAAAAFVVVVLALCWGAYEGKGLHDLSLLFVPVAILAASRLLAGVAFVLFVAVSLAAVTLVALARWHLGIPDPFSTDPAVELLILVVALVVSAIGGRLFARRLEHHLRRARENEAPYPAVLRLRRPARGVRGGAQGAAEGHELRGLRQGHLGPGAPCPGERVAGDPLRGSAGG